MAEKLQYKLLNSEEVPPVNVWEKIAVQLDTEFVAADLQLSKKINEIEIEPPMAAWPSILSKLDNPFQVSETPSAKVVRRPFRRYAVAAIGIGVLFTAALLLLNRPGGSNETGQQAAAVIPPIIIPKAQAEPPSNTDSRNIAISERNSGSRNTTRRARSSQSSAANNELAPYSYAQHIHYTEPVAAVNSEEEIAVQAPLIRDGSGNIIMDAELISYDDNYIVVTGPNGDRTRISKRFLKMIPYLNDALPDENLHGDGAEWKNRFEEWKKRLQNAAFVPAANNYLDIFELKEMIQD